mmetsp:Transcript_3315/g.6884  ORF Transcript_3315/g.6884 Transcript_3315/m.6884 type:complete len:153 (-) Transcript_3315:13-471(-)
MISLFLATGQTNETTYMDDSCIILQIFWVEELFPIMNISYTTPLSTWSLNITRNIHSSPICSDTRYKITRWSRFAICFFACCGSNRIFGHFEIPDLIRYLGLQVYEHAMFFSTNDIFCPASCALMCPSDVRFQTVLQCCDALEHGFQATLLR